MEGVVDLFMVFELLFSHTGRPSTATLGATCGGGHVRLHGIMGAVGV